MSFDLSAGPYLLAHRGAPTRFPENSLEAFADALTAGADVLELDVHMTRDGHIVVAHDPDGTRCAGVPRAIRSCTLAEVKQWRLRSPQPEVATSPVRMPTLEEVLGAFPSTPLNVDVKDPRPCVLDSLLESLTPHGIAQRVLLTSFSQGTLNLLRARGYDGPLGLGRLDAVQALLLPEVATRVRPLHGRRLQIPQTSMGLRLDTRARIERAHRLGLYIDYWVVNDPEVAEGLLDMGADGIVTDQVELIAPIFQRHPRCGSHRARRAARATD